MKVWICWWWGPLAVILVCFSGRLLGENERCGWRWWFVLVVFWGENILLFSLRSHSLPLRISSGRSFVYANFVLCTYVNITRVGCATWAIFIPRSITSPSEKEQVLYSGPFTRNCHNASKLSSHRHVFNCWKETGSKYYDNDVTEQHKTSIFIHYSRLLLLFLYCSSHFVVVKGVRLSLTQSLFLSSPSILSHTILKSFCKKEIIFIVEKRTLVEIEKGYT